MMNLSFNNIILCYYPYISSPAVPSFIINDTIYRHDGMAISEAGARIPAENRARI